MRRVSRGDLLAEQQHLERLESQLESEAARCREQAENAVVKQLDDLARVALKAHAEIDRRLKAAVGERERLAERITQMEQDMLTLKSKPAEAKTRFKGMRAEGMHEGASVALAPPATPAERKMRSALALIFRMLDGSRSRRDEAPAGLESPELADRNERIAELERKFREMEGRRPGSS